MHLTDTRKTADREPKPDGLLHKGYQILLDALGFEAAGVDLLVERTGLRADEVASMLLVSRARWTRRILPWRSLPPARPKRVSKWESVLDILIYPIENYFDADIESAPNPTATSEGRTERAGFSEREVERALEWLEQLSADPQRSGACLLERERSESLDPRELARLDTDCRGYILYLENIGILSAAQRELAIDRLLHSTRRRSTSSRSEVGVLMVLFSQPGQESALPANGRFGFRQSPGHRALKRRESHTFNSTADRRGFVLGVL